MTGESDLVRKFFPATPYRIDTFEENLFNPPKEAQHPGDSVDPEGLTIHYLTDWDNPNRIQGHYALVTSPITEKTERVTFKFRYLFCNNPI